MTLPCPTCSSVNTATANFCSQCGTRLPWRCRSCGADNEPTARFCDQCGTAQDGASPIAASTASHGAKNDSQAPPRSPLAPLPFAEQVIERRQLTVMFCDLVGSTQLSRMLDPEDLRDIVREYRNACFEVVARYDGTTAQYIGDGILVYFGYPTAHEDDARRAALAGLEIVLAVRDLARRQRVAYGVSLSVRVAIHTGLTVVGDLGGAGGTERLALGDTPNIAARLQALAAPDTVVVSLATNRLIFGFFKTTSLGDHLLKGVAEPMEVFRVESPSAARHRLEAVSGRRFSPYVGRTEAIDALSKAWLEASDGGRALLVIGEPGVGKSRLLSVFRETVDAELSDIVECYCSPFFKSTAFYPLVETLRARLGLERGEDVTKALERLRAALSTYALDRDTALPLLAQLLGIPPEAGLEPPALHPMAQKQKALELLLTMLIAPSADKKTLLVIEDLQWVDPTTLEWIAVVIERLSTTPLLLLLTTRPGFDASWTTGSIVSVLNVEHLSTADSETLVRRVVGDKRLPDKVVSLLVDKAGGNPLFVEEMTRMLLDSPLLREVGSHYELTGPLPDVLVPATLQDLLTARLDRMDADAKKVMRLGATIGREFSYELLREVLPKEEKALRRGLDQLLSQGLVFTTGSGFVIKHALIQDAAYESLLKRTRKQYHERIARALEGGPVSAAQAPPERLAQHWIKAGKPHLAIGYCLLAGQKAVASSANEEAAAHLRLGLDLTSKLPASLERDGVELELLSTLGTALSMQKGWAAPEVAEAYSRAQALCDRVGPNPQLFWILWGLWAFYLVKGEQQTALESAQRMMDLARSRSSPAQAVEADFALGLSNYYLGNLKMAREHLERAVAHYVAEEHHANAYLSCQDVGVTSRSVAALVLHLSGEPELALAYSREAIALAIRLKHPFSHAYALGCAAWLHAYRREFKAMGEFARELSELARTQALEWWQLWAGIFAGRAQVDAGAAVEGVRQMEETLALYRGVGTGMVVPYFLGLLAEAHTEAGDVATALLRLDEAELLMAQGKESFPAPEIARLRNEFRTRTASAHPPVATPASRALPAFRSG